MTPVDEGSAGATLDGDQISSTPALTSAGAARFTSQEMERVINRLPIPCPWDRNAFVRTVEAVRGRSITLIPIDNDIIIESACGIWLIREHDDIVLYPDGTSEYHADQIILHELGHMVLGHDRAAEGGTQMIAALTQHLDCSTVRAALGRTAYGTAAEHDAELFASLVLSRRQQAGPTLRNAFFGER